MNGIARCRGVEQVLFEGATDDPVYQRLAAERFCCFYETAERALVAADGAIDLVPCGEDLGT